MSSSLATSKPRLRPSLLVFGAVLVLGGGTLALFSNTELQVNAVRLSAKSDLSAQGKSLIRSQSPNPNLYVEVWSGSKVLKSPMIENAAIGNHLDFDLPGDVRLREIDAVKVWRKYGVLGLWYTSLVDRVAHPEIDNDGDYYHFKMLESYSGAGKYLHMLGFVDMFIGCGVILLVGLKLLRSHAL